jgi:hypothetical protein
MAELTCPRCALKVDVVATPPRALVPPQYTTSTVYDWAQKCEVARQRAIAIVLDCPHFKIALDAAATERRL